MDRTWIAGGGDATPLGSLWSFCLITLEGVTVGKAVGVTKRSFTFGSRGGAKTPFDSSCHIFKVSVGRNDGIAQPLVGPHEVVGTAEHLGTDREVLDGLDGNPVSRLQRIAFRLLESAELADRVGSLRVVSLERGGVGGFSGGTVRRLNPDTIRCKSILNSDGVDGGNPRTD